MYSPKEFKLLKLVIYNFLSIHSYVPLAFLNQQRIKNPFLKNALSKFFIIFGSFEFLGEFSSKLNVNVVETRPDARVT